MNDEKIAADYKVCQMDILELETNFQFQSRPFSNLISNAGSRRFRLAPCPCPQRRQLEELQSFESFTSKRISTPTDALNLLVQDA